MSDPAQRETYDRLRNGTAAQVDAGWERNGDEAVLNDDVVLDVEFHEDSPGEDTRSDRPGHRDAEDPSSVPLGGICPGKRIIPCPGDFGFNEEAPSSKRHHVSEHSFIREKDLLEQALSPQFIIVFIASVLCLWLTPWLCYNVPDV